ncbi:MAG: phosphoenolpyruvate--protein phosphotransferase [Calditrichaceae bacterium]|nr:phosphoenolpyruvate--protein phosphotransferase [Calditrichaceae bacterium]
MKSKESQSEVVLDGIATSPGIAIGPVYLFNPYSINLSELELEVDDIETEVVLFEKARLKVLEQLDHSQTNSENLYGSQFNEIFETQKAFLNDNVLMDEIIQTIKEKKKSAVHTVTDILSRKSEYFINLENTYFRERAFDILDLKQKLILFLVGINIDYHLSHPSIVIAESLSPSDTIHFNRKFILGFLTDKGGKTAHAAILARGLKIPAVVNGMNLSRLIIQDDVLIIDGFNGTIVINPTNETIKKYRRLQKEYQKFEDGLLKDVQSVSETKDGERIQLLANIDLLEEIDAVESNYADGVGLFRTENIFLNEEREPSEENQFNIYKKLAEQMAPKQVVIRTIDIGGDKLIEGYGHRREPNPYLGWRAIRFCLDQPELFKTQLRAIYRASVFGNIKILIPLVSSIDEVIRTKAIIREVKEDLKELNIAFNDTLQIGLMIETPSAAILSNTLADYADYFSIGTNDLTQYVLAIDRTNDKVSKYYNSFNPAVLKMVAETIQAARNKGIDITLCGEFGAQPEAIPLLMGMGLKSFSMTPQYILEAKMIIRSVNMKQCVDLYESVMTLHTANDIEKKCKQVIQSIVPDAQLLK